MNQLFSTCCVFSVILAIVLFKKFGIWRALAIALGLPVVLFVIAVILLIVGGDK